MSNEYLDRGVSPTKEDVHRAIAKHSAGEVPGAFCKVIPDPAGDPQMVAVMHADGAGTKSSVAYLWYAETGDPSAFTGIAQDSLVMNTDDLLCVGATTGFLVSNTIGRNAHRVKGDVISALIDGYESCAAMLREHGIEITLTGGETADVGDLVRTVIADSTVFARVPRTAVGDYSRVAPGDLIVGLSSTGRASYESRENSGIGSNGLTLARHALLAHSYADRFPESYSETIVASKVYCGKFQLKDALPGSPYDVAWGLLSPTRTYLPIVRAILASTFAAEVTGILHCSGGGQTKCRSFGRGLHYVKDSLFPTPALFRAIQDSGIEPKQMYQVFNMGHRLELYVRPAAAAGVIDAAARYGVEAKIIGRIAANPGSEGNRVTIAAHGQTHEYT
ncbi:MAG TPA: AIR synthase-related protein [Polyangiaceae bacterium]|nr:AIR synthase-related protein [Polyangiaceae bacterium]